MARKNRINLLQSTPVFAGYHTPAVSSSPEIVSSSEVVVAYSPYEIIPSPPPPPAEVAVEAVPPSPQPVFPSPGGRRVKSFKEFMKLAPTTRADYDELTNSSYSSHSGRGFEASCESSSSAASGVSFSTDGGHRLRAPPKLPGRNGDESVANEEEEAEADEDEEGGTHVPRDVGAAAPRGAAEHAHGAEWDSGLGSRSNTTTSRPSVSAASAALSAIVQEGRDGVEGGDGDGDERWSSQADVTSATSPVAVSSSSDSGLDDDDRAALFGQNSCEEVTETTKLQVKTTQHRINVFDYH